MTIYTKNTEPGTIRRRAKTIVIHNPAQPTGEPKMVPKYNPLDLSEPPVMVEAPVPQPSITFEMEDRILLADGSEKLVDAGMLSFNIDAEALARLYPHVDIETGAVDEAQGNSGEFILHTIMQLLGDVFVAEGKAREAQ